MKVIFHAISEHTHQINVFVWTGSQGDIFLGKLLFLLIVSCLFDANCFCSCKFQDLAGLPVQPEHRESRVHISERDHFPK